MGWAFDEDSPAPLPPEEQAARDRSARMFTVAGLCAGARAHRRAVARGTPANEFITDSALYRASGLEDGGLPLQSMREWRQKLEQGLAISQDEVDEASWVMSTMLQHLALEALRDKE